MQFTKFIQKQIERLIDRHQRGLVKNIGGAKLNFCVQNVVRTDKCMGVSLILGGDRPGCPQVYAYEDREINRHVKPKFAATTDIQHIEIIS